MRAIVIALLSAVCLSAQTPAKAPAKKASPAKRAPAASSATPAVYDVKFTTTKGDFVVEVHRDWAPLGAARFYTLVKGGYYNGAPIFRVIQTPRPFMAQFGIAADPATTALWEKKPIKDDPVKEHNTRGMITFATAGPNTRTTQVFINYGDNSRLDGQGFTPFGKVTEGMDVVDKFYSGYGEGAPSGAGPDQEKLTNEGKAYVQKSFPKLDTIISAVIVPAAPASKPATPPSTSK